MSNAFVNDDLCCEIFYYVKDGMMDKVQLLAMGENTDWTKEEIGIYCSQEVCITCNTYANFDKLVT